MTKNIIQKEDKKSSGFSLLKSIGFILTGLIIGFGLSYFYINTIQEFNQIKEIKTAFPIKSKPLNLTNPEIQELNFSYSHKRLDDFSSEITATINSLVKHQKIKSWSLYFRDLTSDYFFGINEDETFSPASLMKVPIMIAILKYAMENPNILNYTMTYNARRDVEYLDKEFTQFPSETYMVIGETYDVNRLLEFMVASSDNEATILLLDVLDFHNSKILTEVQHDLGLDIPKNIKYNDNFLTARKYSSFFRTLYNASYLNPEMSNKALNYLAKTGYGFGIKQSIPQNLVICHKFGYQIEDSKNYQLHHFAIVYHLKKPYLIGIMTKGHYVEELKKAITEISKICYDEVETQTKGDLDGLEKDLE